MSDQDFFFDEDEQPKPGAPKGSGSKKSSASGKAAPSSTSSVQSNSMTVTVLVGIIAALLGVIIGIFIGKSMAVPATVAPGVGNTGAGTTTQQAPQLTPEQLQGGELPKGHPDISGSNPGGSTETTTK